MSQKPGTPFTLEVHPRIPRRLARLEELADDLWYSWHRHARSLFARIDRALWEAVGHSPKAFLRSVDERHLEEAAGDPAFLHDLDRTLSAYDAYHEPARAEEAIPLGGDDLVAYFCAEFGFHEGLPIYSGGLGILAGDHCKSASDMRLPFVAVGLLYRQGYFQQSVDTEGRQHAIYTDSAFGDLPISPALRPDGGEFRVAVDLPGREVQLKVWRARVGRVVLYLLDTDLEANRPEDRKITHRLYGGDRTTRVEQEIVLGIGGARAIEAVGLKPTVWHINEGHAAFLVLERVRRRVREGLDFASALEATAVSTVFTTHTGVSAGHDHFTEQIIARYFEGYCGELGVSVEHLLAVGRIPGNGEFNMTALAVRGSRFHNGVSRIHGEVSARLLKELWPQVLPEENPLDSVTNGVHVPTFLAPEWKGIFDRDLGGDWSGRLGEAGLAERIGELPDQVFWSVRQRLKARLLHLVRYLVRAQHRRNQGSESHLDRLLRLADPANPDVLTIGFGRRFATYKRATLLLEDLERLRAIVSDARRPVLFLFAGKAHPADEPGKELLRRIASIASIPEFEGRILFVEGYGLHLSRRLVQGVDVWLNNPIYPMEASGTSGMKAGFNGVLNLSVLDGWWAEGYQGDNGWAIKPASRLLDEQRRDREESRSLYELLEDRVLPLYYDRKDLGYSPEWIKLAKRSMVSLLPRFNSTRMVGEYLNKFYRPASQQGRIYSENGFESARTIARWKEQVRGAWPGVSLRRVEQAASSLSFGEELRIEVAVRLNGLKPEDVVVELVLEREQRYLDPRAPPERHALSAGEAAADGEHRYALQLKPGLCGKLEYRIRAYPCHPLLTHRFELGLLLWV
ncbi:MAG: alpha-glucan family phosphorylase [Burkholderiales bacterium]